MIFAEWLGMCISKLLRTFLITKLCWTVYLLFHSEKGKSFWQKRCNKEIQNVQTINLIAEMQRVIEYSSTNSYY